MASGYFLDRELLKRWLDGFPEDTDFLILAVSGDGADRAMAFGQMACEENAIEMCEAYLEMKRPKNKMVDALMEVREQFKRGYSVYAFQELRLWLRVRSKVMHLGRQWRLQ